MDRIAEQGITPPEPIDQEAFDRVLGSLRPKLHRYCARMVGSGIDGEDVVQEASLKAIEAFPRAAAIGRNGTFGSAADLLQRVTEHVLQVLRHRQAHECVQGAAVRGSRGSLATRMWP
jgi:RNA polymerase sigma-70 factor, ECF subfamily